MTRARTGLTARYSTAGPPLLDTPGSPHDNHFDYHYNVMVMAADTYLGEFEQLILLAVMRLEDDAYGATHRPAD